MELTWGNLLTTRKGPFITEKHQAHSLIHDHMNPDLLQCIQHSCKPVITAIVSVSVFECYLVFWYDNLWNFIKWQW
jgi:hypothetical protein